MMAMVARTIWIKSVIPCPISTMGTDEANLLIGLEQYGWGIYEPAAYGGQGPGPSLPRRPPPALGALALGVAAFLAWSAWNKT